jgi:FkbM family methyltransferase
MLLWLAGTMARLLPQSARRLVYRLPGASLIRRSLNRAAPHGLTQINVAAGDLAGARLVLDLQTEKDYWLGTYEPDLQTCAAELVRPGMRVFDVGANIGYISLLLARRVGEAGRVIAFEALPANQERLSANLALNPEGRRVELVRAAVVDAVRPVRFLVAGSGGMGKAEGSAGRKNVAYAETLEVPGLSLDDFVFNQGQPAPDLIKMDIEGGEVLALPGMARLLAERRPVLLLELHGPESLDAAWAAFSAAGYRICRMEPGCPAAGSPAELDWKAYLAAFPA